MSFQKLEMPHDCVEAIDVAPIIETVTITIHPLAL